MNEWSGVGNHNTALFWEYDTRTGRRDNLDPQGLIWESPYAAFGSNPILNKDVSGNKWYDVAAGATIALFEDAFPMSNSSWRGLYNPSDAGDYYRGLDAGDRTAFQLGAIECVMGEMGEGGGGILTASIVGSEAGIPLMVAGAGVQMEGISSMGNAMSGMNWTQHQREMSATDHPPQPPKPQQTQVETPKADEVQQQPTQQKQNAENKARAEAQEQLQKESENTFGGGGVCFVKGTLVATNKGLRPIESIQKRDSVWAYSEEKQKIEMTTVAEPFVKHTKHLVKLTIGGVDIWATPEHPFYANAGIWINAGNLHKEDMVWVKGGKGKAKVQDVKLVDSSCTVYNMYLDGVHTYWVSVLKVVVHNAGANGNTNPSKNEGKKATGDGKNSQKINQKRQQSWAEKEASLREELKGAKTKGDKKAIQKQIDHAVTKQRASESHSAANKR